MPIIKEKTAYFLPIIFSVISLVDHTLYKDFCLFTAQRLNIQMVNGQTIYEKRTLTYNLQQTAYETNLIYNKQPRKPTCNKSHLQKA